MVNVLIRQVGTLDNKITVSPFIKHADSHIIEAWFKDRNISLEVIDSLPLYGYVGYYEGKPVCMGFIRQCEGDFALIDGLIADKDVHYDIRSQVLDSVVVELIKLSKELQLKTLIAFSSNKNTIMRAIRHGFIVTSDVCIALDLKA